MTGIAEIAPPDAAAFDAEIRPAHRPVVIRGAARDWPLVEAALRSAGDAIAYLKARDAGPRPTS